MTELDTRINKVVKRMEEQSIDCLLISRPENMYYLTNYQTVGDPTQVLILFKNGNIHLVTRELEASNAKYRTNIEYSYYLEYEDKFKKIADYVLNTSLNDNLDIKFIGFEYNSNRLTFKEQSILEERLTDNLDNIEFVDCSLLVSRIRSVKSELEISYARKAAEISAAGIKAGISIIKPGIMETEIAGVVNNAMMKNGCEYSAYPCFVASGDRGCLGHYTPEQKIIQEGELLFMEIGGCYKRYHAAKMHTIFIGNDEPDWFVDARNLIQKAIRSVRKIMKPNVLAGTLDEHMRNIIKQNNHSFVQMERAGYSIGIG